MEVINHGKEPNREAQPATPSKLSRSRRDTNTIFKNGRYSDQVISSNPSPIIEYRECLKNHAASIGGHVMDGCGEFMPGGEDGTSQALKCAACDCHRSFHRKETHQLRPNSPTKTNKTRKVNRARPSNNGHGPSGTVMMAFGGAVAESSSEGLINNVMHSSQQRPKKRFRTKFSKEQKSWMMRLAEKLEWKIQKQDEDEVDQFCSQVGIKRQVFKVWMHNNKRAIKKHKHT